jgi:hypothetical protein
MNIDWKSFGIYWRLSEFARRDGVIFPIDLTCDECKGLPSPNERAVASVDGRKLCYEHALAACELKEVARLAEISTSPEDFRLRMEREQRSWRFVALRPVRAGQLVTTADVEWVPPPGWRAWRRNMPGFFDEVKP